MLRRGICQKSYEYLEKTCGRVSASYPGIIVRRLCVSVGYRYESLDTAETTHFVDQSAPFVRNDLGYSLEWHDEGCARRRWRSGKMAMIPRNNEVKVLSVHGAVKYCMRL